MKFVLTEKGPIISVKKTVQKQSQPVDTQVRSRIYGNGRGWVFTPKHFQGLGSSDSIDSALRRLKATGIIRQLARGLYDYPVQDQVLGTVAPSADAIARALVARDAIRLQPSGAYAANVLGLSEQVPSRIVFLTDGPARKVKIGKREILLQHTTPRNVATAGRKAAPSSRHSVILARIRWMKRFSPTSAAISPTPTARPSARTFTMRPPGLLIFCVHSPKPLPEPWTPSSSFPKLNASLHSSRWMTRWACRPPVWRKTSGSAGHSENSSACPRWAGTSPSRAGPRFPKLGNSSSAFPKTLTSSWTRRFSALAVTPRRTKPRATSSARPASRSSWMLPGLGAGNTAAGSRGSTACHPR